VRIAFEALFWGLERAVFRQITTDFNKNCAKIEKTGIFLGILQFPFVLIRELGTLL
jgi:hypothetical protein